MPVHRVISMTNGKSIKPQIVVGYSRHMGYVDMGDRMANSYFIGRCTWKWTKKLFFHQLDLAILNRIFFFLSCGGKKISHRDFQFALMRNLLAHAGQEQGVPRPLGRQPAVAIQVSRLEVSGSKHWPSLPCSYTVACVQQSV
jgi:hypothetical protein